MKNTVKLEQFKEVTETELQEIRGGEWRIPELIRNLIFPKRKLCIISGNLHSPP